MSTNTGSHSLAVVIFLTGLSFLISGCEEGPKAPVNYAYIGGEIVNPTSKYLILIMNDGSSDTITLSAQNRFLHRLDSVETGLYLLQHRPESQNFYISPGDSLLFRANTLAFDESLHFSGEGDDPNNFLMKIYLQDEQDAELLLEFYKTAPREFTAKTDSILKGRLAFLERMDKQHAYSAHFVELAKKIIHYQVYDHKERYTFLVRKYRKNYYRNLPKDFHEYRKKVRFNEKDLQSNPAYLRFINNYLINKSLQWCDQKVEDDCYNLTDISNIKRRIEIAADLIHLPYLRENILFKLASRGIILSKSGEEMNHIIQNMRNLGFSAENLSDLHQLSRIQMVFLPGNILGDVPVLDSEGNTVYLDQVIVKPTIFYLWSIYNPNHIQDHELVQELRKKYPEINFIGINLDIREFSKWLLATRKYGYNTDHEFQLGKTRIEKNILQFYLNKLLFTDASGKVITGDVFINSPDLESRILEFLNR